MLAYIERIQSAVFVLLNKIIVYGWLCYTNGVVLLNSLIL